MRSDDEHAADEATFREANERIRSAQRKLEPPLERVPYLCECDDVHCHEPIPLKAVEYERIREDGATFAIVPGHSSIGNEVERHEHYVVVRKTDRGGAVARELDPRGDGA